MLVVSTTISHREACAIIWSGHDTRSATGSVNRSARALGTSSPTISST